MAGLEAVKNRTCFTTLDDAKTLAAMLGEKLLETVFILAVLTVCNELLLRSRLRFVLGR